MMMMMMMMMMICHDGFEWKKKENFIEMMINFKNSFLWEKPLRRRTAFQVCLLFTMIFFFVQKKEVSLRHHSLEKLKKSKSSKLKFGLAIGLWFVCLQDNHNRSTIVQQHRSKYHTTAGSSITS